MNLKKIKDGSFNRLMSILKDKEFCIITAYRDRGIDGRKLSKKDNIARNRELRSHLNKNKMGVYQLVGYWREAPNSMDYNEALEKGLLTDVVERSYVVPKPDYMSSEEFIDYIMSLMTIDGLTQDSIIYHTISDTSFGPKGYYIVMNNGDYESIGENVSFNKLGQAYSRSVLKQDVPFVFDSVIQPNGNLDRLAFSRMGYLYMS